MSAQCVCLLLDCLSAQEAARHIAANNADIAVYGHSHKYSVEHKDSMLCINPGAAGPARFKLERTAAILNLPAKVWHAHSFTAWWIGYNSRALNGEKDMQGHKWHHT